MKINKCIVPLLSAFLLVGCNGDNYDNINFAKITDNEALEVAKKIYDTQLSDEFSTPDKITIETNNRKYGSKFNYGNGKYEEDSSTEQIDKIDMTRLVIYSYKHATTKLINESYENKIESYTFYDSDKEIFYVLKDSNGSKTRTETQMSKDAAKLSFEVMKAEYEVNILNNLHLKNYKNIVKIHQDREAQYKDKTDESYKYMFGSDDKTSSLQEYTEGRMKIEDIITHQMKGYIDFVTNDLIKDNKRLYSISNKRQFISLPEDKNVYVKADTIEKTKYKYNIADIKIPNIYDYKL